MNDKKFYFNLIILFKFKSNKNLWITLKPFSCRTSLYKHLNNSSKIGKSNL